MNARILIFAYDIIICLLISTVVYAADTVYWYPSSNFSKAKAYAFEKGFRIQFVDENEIGSLSTNNKLESLTK